MVRPSFPYFYLPNPPYYWWSVITTLFIYCTDNFPELHHSFMDVNDKRTGLSYLRESVGNQEVDRSELIRSSPSETRVPRPKRRRCGLGIE